MSTTPEPAGRSRSPGHSDKDTRDHASDSTSPAASRPRQSLSDKLKALWTKTGLDVPTLSVMFKGSVGPLISTACFQATSWAEFTSISGYLVTIITILGLPIMPRGKFLNHIFLMAFAVTVAWALVLLALFCCIKARSTSENVYDSSAAAVAGVWLFVLVYLNNVLRFNFPPFMIPGIATGIIINISIIYAPVMGTMTYAITFTKHVVEELYIGMAIAFGVHFVILPTNMRGIVFKEMTGFLMTTRKLMGANLEYIQSLETGDMFCRTPTNIQDRPRRKEVQDVKAIISQLVALHGKLSVDIPFAKREVAWGKLGPDNLSELHRRLRRLMFVVVGFSSLNDIFERATERQGWNELIEDIENSELPPAEASHAESVRDWHEIAGMLQAPFQHVTGHIDDGLAHILVGLQLMPQKAAVHDLEASGNRPNPGDPGYTDHFAQKMKAFKLKRSLVVDFCKLKGIDLPADLAGKGASGDFQIPLWSDLFPDIERRQRYHGQLFAVLWMDFLLESIGQRVHEFCVYVDEKAESGKLSKKRLIVPGYKRLRKYFTSLISTRKDHYNGGEGANLVGDSNIQGASVYLGAAYHQRLDPEHLPPQNWVETVGDRIRRIPHFLRSKESAFGLRAALATMCIAIIGLLKHSHAFSIAYRTFWGQIMISFALSPSSAQSLAGFTFRILGTSAACVASFVVWYIVDGKAPGVIVFYWFALTWGFWFMWKFPTKIIAGMIYNVTLTLVIGYELQTRKLGIAASERTGQKYFPIYELGPFRLLVVGAAMTIAWFWSIFPFPLSEHSALRKDMGSGLYLLAKYNSIMDEVVKVRLRGHADLDDPESPFHALQKMRDKVFAKCAMTMPALRMHVALLTFDIPIGGRFPKEIYIKVVDRMQSLTQFMTMVILASKTFAEECDPDATEGEKSSQEQWIKDFRRLVDIANTTNRECTTLLAMLSAAISSGNPLPPYMQAPSPYDLVKKLDTIDANIMGINHIFEPGFTAFACLQLGTKCITDDVRALLRHVKELVGEMDFSFHSLDNDGDSLKPIKSVKRE